MASDAEQPYRFATELWDGFDAVASQTEFGLQVTKDVMSILKKRAEIESDYSKKLAKLASSSASRRVFDTPGGSAESTQLGTCAVAWSSFLDSCAEQAQAHAEASASLEETVVASLASFVKDMEAARKTIVADGVRRIKDKKEAEDAVAKAKAAYFKASDNYNSAVTAHNTVSSNPASKTKEVNKAASKMAKTKTSLDQAVQDYEFQIKSANGIQAKFLSRHMPKTLDDLQHVETVRIHILKTNLRKTARILEAPPPRTAKAILTFKGIVAAIDNDSDMRAFITENKTYQLPPPPFEFEQHGAPAGASARSSSSKRSKRAESTANPETSVFGVSLEDVLRKSVAVLPSHPNIPRLLPLLCHGISAMDGASAEGLFRLSGESNSVKDLKARLDAGMYSLDGITDVHVLTGTLKLWFRELRDPLIPDDFYTNALAISSPADAGSLFADLSTPRQAIMQYLMGYLATLSSPEIVAVTKMTADNLAMIFAPSFLRCPDPALLMTNAEPERFAVKCLYDYLIDLPATHDLFASVPASVE